MKLEDGRWTLKWQLVLRNVSSWCIVMTSCFFISKYTWNISLIFASLKSFHFYYIVSAVQASIAANTWVVSGASQTKKLQDLLPGIINQLGPDNLVNLKRLAQQFQRQENAGAEDADDDDVPDLVEGESFEEAAKQEAAV
jgi:hypothetical protein